MSELSALLDRCPRRLMVVAHPDDEIMWGGALMAAYPGDWTVACMSVPQRDPERAWKFYDACKAIGAQGRVVPMAEPAPDQGMTSMYAVDLQAMFPDYDLIVTHGMHGEYGHRHHRDLFFYCQRFANRPLLTFHGKHAIASDEKTTAHATRALREYDHRVPYPPLGDEAPPKWQALMHRYNWPHLDQFGTYDIQPEKYHWHVLADMAHEHGWKHGAELGVRWGQTSSWLLEHCPDLSLIGVDLMEPQPDHPSETYVNWPWEHHRAEVAAIEREFPGRFHMCVARTDDVAKQVEDASLDFVFIDADHSYEGVAADIDDWAPKVKPGGYVTGHDIDREDIRRAVRERFSDWDTQEGRWNNIWWTPVENYRDA